MSRDLTRWLWSLMLLLPVVIFYYCQYAGGDEATHFSGFIYHDMGVYIADSRSFFSGGFHPFYSNPFSPDPETPGLYFQPQFLLIGAVMALTHADPGVIFVAFGFISGLICIRLAIAVFEEYAGMTTPGTFLGVVLFVWGGGVLTIVGGCYHFLLHRPPADLASDLLAFDPYNGWWFLNFGRNLIYPTEAYYHAISLAVILLAARGRYGAVAALAALMSMSHPFTGLQVVMILVVWSGLERLFIGNKNLPIWFGFTLLGILTFHLGYYLYFLNLFPEHRSIVEHFSQRWVIPAVSFLPADALVGLLAYWAARNLEMARELFSKPANRLLLAWFAVSFLLAHHDFAVEPRQPIHFSRGYTWIPLFLLGIQPLLKLIERCQALEPVILRSLALCVLLTLGLLDNLFWIGQYSIQAIGAKAGRPAPTLGIRLKDSDRELFAWLMQRPGPHRELLVSPNQTYGEDTTPIIYLTTVYTDYRGWCSQITNTPYFGKSLDEQTDFFLHQKVPPGWQGRSLLIIQDEKRLLPLPPIKSPILFQNDDYRVQAMTMP